MGYTSSECLILPLIKPTPYVRNKREICLVCSTHDPCYVCIQETWVYICLRAAGFCQLWTLKSQKQHETQTKTACDERMMLRYVLDCPGLQAFVDELSRFNCFTEQQTLCQIIQLYILQWLCQVITLYWISLNILHVKGVSISFIWTLAVRSSSSSDYLPKKEF